MKTLTGHKSLLLGSGLLLISLVGLGLSQQTRMAVATAARVEKHAANPKCRICPDGGSYVKDIAEKLFPVLKSLNLM